MGGIHHLVSRGVELAYQQAGNDEELKLDMPSWVPGLLAATMAFYLFVHLSATYSFGLLVPTLTMVESPSATAIVRTTERYQDDESPDAPLLSKEEKESQKPRVDVDEEIMVLANKPVTSKLRSVMRHIREQTGSTKAHWRGVGGFFIYNVATMWAIGFARTVIPFRTCAHLLHIPVAGLLCLLSTAWVQQMVAMPGKNYFQRVSELSRSGAFCKLIFPVMAIEVVETAVYMLPRQLSILFGFASDMSKDAQASVGIMSVGIFVATVTLVFSFIFVVIPLNIGLVRFQASLLSEESETIVPMDRSLGGAEKKNIKSAWKSFSREGCRNLAKNYVKYIMLQFALATLLTLTLATELYAIFGSDAVEVVRKHAEKAHRMMM